MGELSLPLLVYVIIFLSLPFLFGYIARHFKLPLILGYIVSGVFLSLLFKTESQTMLSLFANIGLLLLLFTVGLDLHLDSFRRLGRFVLVGGFLQIIGCVILTLALCLFFGFGVGPSLLISIAFSFSSTAIVSKLMVEADEEETLYGRLTMGMLLFQDLMVIPLMVVLSSLTSGQTGFGLFFAVIASVTKSAIILGLVYVFGEKVVPKVFERIGKRSVELLNLFSLVFIFLVVFFFTWLGLPGTVAAFVAGLLVGQTHQHTQVFSNIRPMKDIFAILFFVFLGATLDMSSHIDLVPFIVIFGLLLVLIKIVVTTIVFAYLRFHSKVAFAIGVLLAQVGEFAFILLHQANATRLIDDRLYFMSVGITLFTIVITPIAVEKKDVWYKKVRSFVRKYVPALDHFISYGVDRDLGKMDEAELLENHVIVCGYGDMGKYICRALKLSNIPYVVVDYDYYLVKSARGEDVSVVYGDSTQVDVLDSIGTQRATCLVAVVPNTQTQESILLAARLLNPDLVIFTRVNKEDQRRRMKDLGAQVVVQPEFEGAVSIIKKILTFNDISKDDIVGKIKRLKIEHGMA